jgi:CheY-like chemotaxis protein
MSESLTPKNRIVYADDDPDDLELVQDAFRRYTYDVDVILFTDGIRVLNYFRTLSADSHLPCLIILDVNMPGLNGREVLVALREMPIYKSTPVVLFTTSNQPADRNFAEKYGAGMITKPLDVRHMEVIASQFIDHCSEDIQKEIRRQIR